MLQTTYETLILKIL